MAKTISHGIKSALIAIAVILFGMGFAVMSTSMVGAILLYIIAGIVSFFAVIVETPAADLPTDLQKLKKDLESITGLSGIVALLEQYQTQLEYLLESILSDGTLTEFVKGFNKYSATLSELLSAIMEELQKQKIPLDKIDYQKFVSNLLASVPVKKQ